MNIDGLQAALLNALGSKLGQIADIGEMKPPASEGCAVCMQGSNFSRCMAHGSVGVMFLTLYFLLLLCSSLSNLDLT